MFQELRKLDTSSRALRNFGWVLCAALLIFAVVFLVRGRASWWWFLAASLGFGFAAVCAPQILYRPYVAWMAVGLILGTIISTILLVLLFYLVVTPIGLLARAFGNDFLHSRWGRSAPSYWRKRDAGRKSNYQRQF